MCLYAFGSLLCYVVAPSEPPTSLAICDRGQPVVHWMVHRALAPVASSSVKVRSVQKPSGEIDVGCRPGRGREGRAFSTNVVFQPLGRPNGVVAAGAPRLNVLAPGVVAVCASTKEAHIGISAIRPYQS